MRGAFGPGAKRLAGIAGHWLGWRPAEFWAATPAELAAILLPEPDAASTPLSRAEFNELMERDNASFRRR